MVERTLLTVLLAGAVLVGASAISDAFHKMTDRLECGFDRANVCILDDDREQN